MVLQFVRFFVSYIVTHDLVRRASGLLSVRSVVNLIIWSSDSVYVAVSVIQFSGLCVSFLVIWAVRVYVELIFLICGGELP